MVDSPGPAARDHGEEPVVEPARPYTLGVDVGGTGIKASVVDRDGKLVAKRVRVATTYPLTPGGFVEVVCQLVRPLPSFDRVAIGFPGVVRFGRIVTAPHFVTAAGPGSHVVPELVNSWRDFDAADALAARLGHQVRIANDADLAGLAVVSGEGLEFVMTLGTGVGTALFSAGVLAPHLEFAHHPFRKGETYNEQLGEQALERVGARRWRRRVLKAVSNFEALINFDRCYIGGGNAKLLQGRVDAPLEICDNVAGIVGAVKLFDEGGE